MLSDKFDRTFDHKKLINNRKLMLFSFNKKFYNFFKIKCQSTFELTTWLIFSHCSWKCCSRFFLMQQLPFGKFFIFMPFGNYAIWDVILEIFYLFCEESRGGISHTRRTECAKIKNSQSDFSNLKFGKKVNISRDWILILAYIKTAELFKVFKLSLTAAELEQNLYFKGLVMKDAKYCFI